MKPRSDISADPFAPAVDWMVRRGWQPFAFQRDTWIRMLAGESGLLHCSTGTGKTYAVWLGALLEALQRGDTGGGMRVLWITPLRALAADTESALAGAASDLLPAWSVARRTGDTNAYQRRKQSLRPSECLVTTPESLCVLLSQPTLQEAFAAVRWVIVDEWHELLGTKRGVLLELALSRLRALAPGLAVWGLSATLGNLDEAAGSLAGYRPDGRQNPLPIIQADLPKKTEIETLLPDLDSKIPWGGHLGLALLPRVVAAIRGHGSTIVFTNTRSQAELWFRALSEAMGGDAARLGLHHGSLSNDARREAEDGLRSGALQAVVATSSLDLGVDFAPVDCVIQIGSPKGVARLLQRAGRSGHRPGATSRVLCVPANTLELAEIAAARDLAQAGRIECRRPIRRALDVLCQHLVTVAAGGGFSAAKLLVEVRSTHAFRELTDEEWAWTLDFATRGGAALRAYPEYARLIERDGFWHIRDEPIAKRHRLAIGTITSDAAVEVVFQNGARLGQVEESFVAKMKSGDRFLFGGRCLELVRVRDLRAVVKRSTRRPTAVPRWMGGRMPLSSELSDALRENLTRAVDSRFDSPELERLRPVLEIQRRLSRIPRRGEFLVERLTSREGHHLFLYPFEGRLVHEGLAALFAFRLARHRPLTFSLAVNDYGLELLSADPVPLEDAWARGLLSPERLTEDILGSIEATELARRRFREIARVAGLILEGPGKRRKSTRQLTISASLLYDVCRKYDPDNRLVAQAAEEVLENQLEQTRLRRTLEDLAQRKRHVVDIPHATPLSFPLFIERLREKLSSEELAERVRRMELQMEGA